MEDINRLPAAALSVPELIEALVNKPEFRGIVIFDPSHQAGRQYGDESSPFQWRSMNCDARRLVSGVNDFLAAIPSGPKPPEVGNGQSS